MIREKNIDIYFFFFPKKKRSRKGLLPQNFIRKERNTKEQEGDIGPKPPKN